MIRQDHPSRSSFFARKIENIYQPKAYYVANVVIIVKLFRRSYGTQHNPGLPIGQPKGLLSWCVELKEAGRDRTIPRVT